MPSSKTKVSKLLQALVPRTGIASSCVYDAGLDDEIDEEDEYLNESYHRSDVGDTDGIVRFEELSDGTMLLRARTRSLDSAASLTAQMQNISIADFMCYGRTHAPHARSDGSSGGAPRRARSLQRGLSLQPPATAAAAAAAAAGGHSAAGIGGMIPEGGIPYLQMERSVANSERDSERALFSSATLGSRDLSGIFFRGNSMAGPKPE